MNPYEKGGTALPAATPISDDMTAPLNELATMICTNYTGNISHAQRMIRQLMGCRDRVRSLERRHPNPQNRRILP